MYSLDYRSAGFLASLSTDMAFTASEYIRFDIKEYDFGNNYNPATGVYIVPYAGMYLIHARVFGLDNHARHYIMVDGNDVTYTFEYNSDLDPQSSSTSITLHLQSGQEVAIALYLSSGSSTVRGGTTKMYTSFGATLIYGD